MTRQRLRIGLIGCGEIAAVTAQGMREAQHAAIAAVMDVNPTLAQDLASTYGMPWFRDVDELLSRPDVDAVYIAVPHHLHAALTIQAARCGKHVLCEKPIATTLADADRMIAACAAAGVALSIAFAAQVTPAMQRARELIASDAIGEVIGVHITELIDKPATYWASGYTGRAVTDWRTSKVKAGGGALMMNSIHDINTVRYLTGLEAIRVYAEYGTFATPVEVEDYLAATVRYSNGAVGHIEVGSCIKGGTDAGSDIRIFGSTGQIVLGNPPRLYTERSMIGRHAGTWQNIAEPLDLNARSAIVEGFAGAVLARRQPPVSGLDGRAALALVLAAYQSGQEGRPVEVDRGPRESGAS